MLASHAVAPEDFRDGGILSGDEGLEWAEGAFDELARSLPRLIAVEIFDGEGFALWKPA